MLKQDGRLRKWPGARRSGCIRGLKAWPRARRCDFALVFFKGIFFYVGQPAKATVLEVLDAWGRVLCGKVNKRFTITSRSFRTFFFEKPRSLNCINAKISHKLFVNSTANITDNRASFD